MDIEKISKHGRGAQSPARPLCDAEARREGGTSPLCPRNLLTVAVLTLLMVACAICVGDADGDESTTAAVSTSFVSGDLTYTVLSDDDRTVSITGSKPNLVSISFVEYVNYGEKTYRVTAISGSGEEDAYKGAFQDQTGLASVTIPDHITSIGAKAFSGCVKLGELTIGSGVTSIGDEAFKGCVKLGDLTIRASVESVGAGAFTN